MTLPEHFVNNARLQKEWSFDRNATSPDNFSLPSLTHIKPCKQRENVQHKWTVAPDSPVSQEYKYPYCNNSTASPNTSDIPTLSSEMLKLWHPTRNGTLRPTDITPSSNKRIWWQCELGHAWQAPAYSVKAGSRCPYCVGKKPIVGETDLATTHPHITKMWSCKNTLSPTEVTAGSQKKIWFVCNRGHEWETHVATVALLGCGCPYCSGNRAILGETDLATIRPDILAEWDYQKNTNIDPTKTLPSAHKKVWWKCAQGHSWLAYVFSRTKNKGTNCPYCSGKKVLSGFNDLATLKPQIAGEWHPTLNGDLTPAEVTLGSNKKVWWQCSEKHIWQAYIYARTKPNSSSCPVCARKVRLPSATR